MSQAAIGSSLNRVLTLLEVAVTAHQMNPSFGYGSPSDINASNDVIFPLVWVEPTDSSEENSVQGVRVELLSLNLYCLDRITKGDSNYREIHSDTKYILQTLIGGIRESQWGRDNYLIIGNNITYRPVTRATDENCNGWMCRLEFRVPVLYNTCDSPFSLLPDGSGGGGTCDDAYVINSATFSVAIASGGTYQLSDYTIDIYVNGVFDQSLTQPAMTDFTLNIS